MSNAGLSGAVAAGARRIAERGGTARILAIEEVTARGTVIKCMGRTYSAVAVNGEVSITDVTDITRQRHLGTARSRDEHGAWHILSARHEHVLTTPDLLRAVAALRESTNRAFVPPRGGE